MPPPPHPNPTHTRDLSSVATCHVVNNPRDLSNVAIYHVRSTRNVNMPPPPHPNPTHTRDHSSVATCHVVNNPRDLSNVAIYHVRSTRNVNMPPHDQDIQKRAFYGNGFRSAGKNMNWNRNTLKPQIPHAAHIPSRAESEIWQGQDHMEASCWKLNGMKARGFPGTAVLQTVQYKICILDPNEPVSDKYIVASWHPALADECFFSRFQLSSLRCLVAQLWKKCISLWCDSFTLCNMHNVMCSSPTFTSLQVFHINLYLVVQGDEHDTTCFHASTIWTLTSDCNKYWPSWHVELATDGSRRNGMDAASLDASCGRQGLHPKLLIQQKWTARECGLKGWKLRITFRISLVAEPNITNVYMYSIYIYICIYICIYIYIFIVAGIDRKVPNLEHRSRL